MASDMSGEFEDDSDSGLFRADVEKAISKAKTFIDMIDNLSKATKEKDMFALLKAGCYAAEGCYEIMKPSTKKFLKDKIQIGGSSSVTRGMYRNLLRHKITKRVAGEYLQEYIEVAKMFDVDVYFNIRDSYLDGVYINKEKQSIFQETFKEFVWKRFDSKFLLLQAEPGENGYRSTPDIVADTNAKPFFSKKAQDFVEYMRLCESKNIKRNILFYGPPGTGKSSLIKYIVQELNMKSLRISPDMCGTSMMGTTSTLIKILKPDIIIIDDIDRIIGSEKLIDLFDMVKDSVNFVFATANIVNKISPPLLRPGRFDEFFLIDRMDEGLIRKLFEDSIGCISDEMFEKIKHLPIAYINELKIRAQIMSLDEATKTIDELIVRANKLSKEEDSDDDAVKENDDIPKAENVTIE